MSEKIDNSGDAFPVLCGQWHSTPGMSLRDWFAGQALAGMHMEIEHPTGAKIYAENAYWLADAMLEARKK